MPLSDLIWSLGRAVHRLADRIWDLADWISDIDLEREIRPEEGQ